MTATTTADHPTGLNLLTFKREQREHPIFKRMVQALREERQTLLEQLAHPQNIEQTTLLRGQLILADRISARLNEVGPESRQSEPAWPESAHPVRAAADFPVSY